MHWAECAAPRSQSSPCSVGPACPAAPGRKLCTGIFADTQSQPIFMYVCYCSSKCMTSRNSCSAPSTALAKSELPRPYDMMENCMPRSAVP